MDHTPLIIYKASAGSGKTFTLATEYIKLVVNNPQAYKQILAVTFTNKATEEMKLRILSQLYGIWKNLNSSKQYMDAISKELHASPEFISYQAGIALTGLLHNYSYFRITTIDTFFQSVLRNLARELDLTANLRIGLNDIQVEEMAVDELIENLSVNDQVLNWILTYVKESISDDRSWNIIGKVKKFGQTLFRDYYKSESDSIKKKFDDPDFFNRYTRNLRLLRSNSKSRLTELADIFFAELQNAGLDVSNLSNGEKGVAGTFIKIQKESFKDGIMGKRAKDCIGHPELWYTKKEPQGERIHDLVVTILEPLLREVAEKWKTYKSADLTLRHLNQLRLLDSIEKKVHELNQTANRFLLSDTQQLLHKLIDNSDSPFIFEKIGTQLEHIMIDEFQDTSTVQWKNFKVLLEETMSHAETENLIVGDVKQSIYRWRSGDWRLLANINDEFPHKQDMLRLEPLDTNYRSSRRVIDFNNEFFTKAACIESVSAYNDVWQKVPAKKPAQGYVNITLLPSEDYQQRVLDLLLQQVSMLVSQGISTSQIAILVRSNRLIPLIANFFMERMPSVRIVSDEAFQLDASPAIQVIIQALRLLVHPADNISKAYLASMYAQKQLHTESLDSMLPPDFINHRAELLRLPLYELTERLCDIFRLQEMEGQSAYLYAFYDQVANHVNERSTDIAAFLAEWDETICTTTIQSPEIDGIRLISIHKSKGLEFPYVLIPYCDWSMEHSSILWCKPTEEPFNELPIVPIDYSEKSMSDTIYEHDYEEEHQQNVVDNLNLLYVAFTRASEGLFAIGKRGTKSSRCATIEKALPDVSKALKGSKLEGKNNKETPLVFEYGDLSVAEPEASDEEDDKKKNVFLQEWQPVPITMETFHQKTEFRQSNDSRSFAQSPEDEEARQQNEYIKMGNILHNVFSTIRTTADIDAALQRLELEGILYDNQLTNQRLQHMIRKRIEDPRVASWYSDHWQLFNECTILSIDPEDGSVCERRPDRVMTDGNETIVVDFKFGHPNNDYKKQVHRYMELLTEMGHPNVKGYLWYVYSNKIEEVS